MRSLKPSGVLVGSTPFIFPIHDEPSDSWRFTKYGLETLFEKCQDIEIYKKVGFFETLCLLVS